ncbi:hypothetical protein HELRODRAFT_103444 [Helobdella robusta]|uniref:Uncharacterized protein n=1 Tax=Helobdella robusta TaxID=6412 RepID=T1EDG2_HELRO|nr:hypothetical protein HELRODRAFT_103444 [Helobdella robusta]ESN93531.1 hypothetical protein HELRODRAFT_103444 [Helobdella robusta]
MSGKVFIVTGANTGIGFETTKMLCEAGHDVILACRSEEKTAKAIEKLKKKLPNALATYMHLDLADMESVRKFVEDFHATGKKLNVLINNAGLGLNFKDTKRQYTKDNFELTMGTNHLGHFLLTNLLLKDLKKTASGDDGEARIVVVASSLHDPETNKKLTGNLQSMDLDDLFMYKEGAYNGMQAYKNSKAANIMFAYELSRQLAGTNVTVNAVCPGFIPATEFMRNSGKAMKFFCRYVLRFSKITRTVHQGASSLVSLATDEKYKGVTGKYVREDQEYKSSEETLDESKQQKLWQISGGYVKLEGFEPLEPPTPPAPEPAKSAETVKSVPEEAAEVPPADSVATTPAVNGVKQTVEEVKTEVKEVAGDVAEQVKQDVTAEVTKIQENVTEIKKEVSEKIETGLTDLKTKADDIIENVETSVKDVVEGLTSTESPAIIAAPVENPVAVEG